MAIAPGKLWESEIKKAIDESFFFIPIVTPRSVSSKYCKFEFESFLARESAIGRNDLVFPILYISVGALESETKWRDDLVLSIIGRRQYVDWRPLRHLDVQTSAVREQIERVCRRMVEALDQPWISPEERRSREEAIRRQAEEEARLEAKRKDEEETRRLDAKRKAEEEVRRLEAKRKDEEEQQRKQLEAKAREAEAKRLVDEEKRRKRAEREPMIATMGEVFADKARGLERWRVGAGLAAILMLLLVGAGGYTLIRYFVERGVHQAELRWEEDRSKAAASAEEKRKAEEAEQQRQANIKAEQEHQARADSTNDKKGGTADSKTPVNKMLGIDLAGLTDELRTKYNIKDNVKGVLITGVEPNSIAEQKRLTPGHVIAEVQQERVTSETDFQQRMEKLKMEGKRVALLLVLTPNGEPSFVALSLQ